MSNILIIDDDVASCRTLQLHFKSQGHRSRLAHTADDGLDQARSMPPDVIIMDIEMPGRSGLEALPDFKQSLPDVPVLMITAFDDMDTTIQAMKFGAEDYIRKPIDIDEMDNALAHALLRIESEHKSTLISADEGIDNRVNTMVGRSRAMQDVFKTIGLVAQKPVTVLIRGAIALGVFGVIGAFVFQIVAKNIAVDIQRNQIEELRESQNAAQMQSESAENPQL